MADLHHQIPINASPQKVYAALTTVRGLSGWWTADSKIDDKAGGTAEFGFDKRGVIFRMTIEDLKPNEAVVWSCHGEHPEWRGTKLTWKISAQDGGTTLRFTHGNWEAVTDFFAICNSSWGELMYRLKDYAEGKNPGPHWRE